MMTSASFMASVAVTPSTPNILVGGEVQLNADPQDSEGADLVVPVPPDMALTQAAERFFAKHRRALRGRRRAKKRLEALVGRDGALTSAPTVYRENTSLEVLSGNHRVQAAIAALALGIILSVMISGQIADQLIASVMLLGPAATPCFASS